MNSYANGVAVGSADIHDTSYIAPYIHNRGFRPCWWEALFLFCLTSQEAQMSYLFDTSTDNIGLHLKNIYNEGELDEIATTEDYSVVRKEGQRQVRRKIKHYNLDAIISVGYRVSSSRATQFRQWATQVLKQHLVEGYTLNQKRLQERGVEFEQAIDAGLASGISPYSLRELAEQVKNV